MSLCLPWVCGFPRRPEEGGWLSLSWSNGVISLQMWVQGTELGSSERPSVPHCYTNFLVSCPYFISNKNIHFLTRWEPYTMYFDHIYPFLFQHLSYSPLPSPPNFKLFKKIHWVQFVLSIYSWGSTYWRVVDSSDHTLKKTDPPLPEAISWGGTSYPPSSMLEFCLAWAHAGLAHLSQLLSASVQLSFSVWKTPFPYGHPLPLAHKHFSAASPTMIPEPLKKGYDIDIPFRTDIP